MFQGEVTKIMIQWASSQVAVSMQDDNVILQKNRIGTAFLA